ncbi:MAG: DUF1599 domain-containing protein [Sphaerochaeta sp.]|jgi:hypothetical protein|nr:DUF1599 domain-containing protein [Sphaerochaeta sp.]
MTADERNARIRGYFENECMALLEKKGHDYAGNADCLKNLRRHGLRGIVVRLGDKYERIDTLTWGGDGPAVKGESIRDTLIDLVNYSLLAMIFLDDEGAKRPNKPKTQTSKTKQVTAVAKITRRVRRLKKNTPRKWPRFEKSPGGNSRKPIPSNME